MRMQGSSKTLKPILLIAHLDVVEAIRADWSLDPYKLTERDGYFYGRGTSDVKGARRHAEGACLRLHREHVVLERDADSRAHGRRREGGPYNGVAWLLATDCDLIDAVLVHQSEDGGGALIKAGRRLVGAVQPTEKRYLSYYLDGDEQGRSQLDASAGQRHCAPCRCDRRASRYHFPFDRGEITRAYFQRLAALSRAAPRTCVLLRRRARRGRGGAPFGFAALQCAACARRACRRCIAGRARRRMRFRRSARAHDELSHPARGLSRRRSRGAGRRHRRSPPSR